MRIGINANFFQKPSTGIGVVTLQFMRTLVKLPEQSAHEWIWYYEGEVPKGEWPANWRFQPVKTFWQRDDLLHRYFWEHFSLPKAVKNDQCEIFFSLYQSTTILPLSIRHVMLVHDLIPKRFPEYLTNIRQRLYQEGVERGIRSATKLIVPSEATREDLETLLSFSKERIQVIPLGLDPQFEKLLDVNERDSVLSHYGLTAGYFYHGGGLEKRKNTAIVLEAYRKLLDERVIDSLPPLVISGTIHAETNPLATPVQSLIAKYDLSEHVRLLGWVPPKDLPALYQGAVCFIFPSRYEGFGLPVLEAFASGAPVVTTAAGSLGELASGAARIVLADDATALASALREILTDPVERERLSRLGKERATHFQWESFASAACRALLP